MSIDRVRAYLRERGLEDKIQEFEVSSATVELAAQAAGVIPARIAKSLTFMLPEGPAIVVAAGDAKIDNAKFKAQFHVKAKMLAAEEVAASIGHAVGGVCPFAIEADVRVYLDVSLKRFESVYPACGSANSAYVRVGRTCNRLNAASMCKSGAWGVFPSRLHSGRGILPNIFKLR